ncbi:MAG: hypothetical protein IKE24_07080 [Clostridia bacterium]|nr:hypothetical protein [Clostridia bacterium]
MTERERKWKRLRGMMGLALLLAALAGAFLLGTRWAAKEPAERLPLAGRIVLLAGDSRSSTDYTFYRQLLEKKSGCQVLVEGASGKTAAYNASDAYFERLEQPHDFSLWLVGGNDPGEPGTVGTFSADSALAEKGEPVVEEADPAADLAEETFIQSVDRIMRKYRERFYDFRTRDDGRRPIMIFCTDLPQQRDGAESPWSQKENWERKRLAILECCEKNRVPCLDLYTLCGFDLSFEPFYTEPTDTETNRGLYYMDGLHPNREGFDRITSLEIAEMIRYGGFTESTP